MKRVGHLFDAVIERDNLLLAFWKASRGKRVRDDQRRFAANLEDELAKLRDGLLSGDYPIGDFRRFTIYDPKEREICAAAFGERVLHHALMNVCEPYFGVLGRDLWEVAVLAGIGAAPPSWLILHSVVYRKPKGRCRTFCA